MIESKQEVSKDLEKALQALEQAKQRVETAKLPSCSVCWNTKVS